MLLAWRNDPLTRQASHHSDVVTWDEHRAWLLASLNSHERQLLVAEIDAVPVGTVRADRSDEAWVLSWTVAPEARGKGIAPEMVALAADQIDGPVRAEIKRDNSASIKAAVHAGMTLLREEGDILHYERPHDAA